MGDLISFGDYRAKRIEEAEDYDFAIDFADDVLEDLTLMLADFRGTDEPVTESQLDLLTDIWETIHNKVDLLLQMNETVD